MRFAVAVAICLLQTQIGGATTPDKMERDVLVWQAGHPADSTTGEATSREAKFEEQQFVSKFNHLLETLRDFADQYNHRVIDVKKVKALKKAWRDLEKTDGWFRLDENSGR